MGTAQTTSYGGLIPGTSYFFRTWSWKTGGTWSAAYAEDVATTPASTTASNPTLPQIIDPTGVTAPTTYWTDPNTTFVATLPIYPMTQYVSTGTGIPIATIWVWIGVGIVLLVLVAFSITKTPIIIAGAGLLVISTLSIMGLFPMLVFYASILMGIPVLWVLSKN
jgi:hypothetical protein